MNCLVYVTLLERLRIIILLFIYLVSWKITRILLPQLYNMDVV